MTEIRVKTQEELDHTLARTDLNYGDWEIVIDSPLGVWMTLYDSKGLDVQAYDSATVQAYDSATVRAAKYVAVHLFSQRVTLRGVLIDMTRIDMDAARRVIDGLDEMLMFISV